ncbi:hypothetical protein T492DRAFT_831864 [Pavlovales sp. CCMP2436]|nr:hypothetical protein T492DRAFT_831864 [Pavlovales sp. CCMP2436]
MARRGDYSALLELARGVAGDDDFVLYDISKAMCNAQSEVEAYELIVKSMDTSQVATIDCATPWLSAPSRAPEKICDCEDADVRCSGDDLEDYGVYVCPPRRYQRCDASLPGAEFARLQSHLLSALWIRKRPAYPLKLHTNNGSSHLLSAFWLHNPNRYALTLAVTRSYVAVLGLNAVLLIGRGRTLRLVLLDLVKQTEYMYFPDEGWETMGELEFCKVVNMIRSVNKDTAKRAFYKHHDGCALKLKYLEQVIGRGCLDASWINQVALTGTGHTHFLTKDGCGVYHQKEYVSISDVLFMEGLAEKLGKTLMRCALNSTSGVCRLNPSGMVAGVPVGELRNVDLPRLLRRLKVGTGVALYVHQQLNVRGAVLSLIIGDPFLTGAPQLVGILGHTTFPHQALDDVDPATFQMTFTLEPGVKPGEAYQRLQGICALILARSLVAHDQVVGSARQLGTTGPEFGDDYKGALRLQHGCRLVNGHDVKCIVNSQSVQTARWQPKLFSQTLFKLSVEASLTLLPGTLEVEIFTLPMTGDNVIRQKIMVNQIWDLGTNPNFSTCSIVQSSSEAKRWAVSVAVRFFIREGGGDLAWEGQREPDLLVRVQVAARKGLSGAGQGEAGGREGVVLELGLEGRRLVGLGLGDALGQLVGGRGGHGHGGGWMRMD